MPANSNDELNSAERDYKMFAANDDMGLNQMAEVLASKLGESFRGPIKDLGMMLQSMLGMGNKGVSSAVSVLGGMQSYGAPGMVAGMGSGLIGGRDVATTYAAAAVNRNIMQQFHDPVTGSVSPMAHGLNQAQMGQAMALSMSTGMQYSAGNIFEARTADRDYIARLKREGAETAARTGNKSMLTHANSLREGQTDFILNEAGKRKMTQGAEEAASVLGAINDVMGSTALKNLEDSMQKLFGGSAAQYGMRAARVKMLNLQASSSYYGEGDAGVKAAIAAQQTTAGFINTGNSVTDMMSAGSVEKMTRAAARNSMVEAGVAMGLGYSKRVQTHAEIAQNLGIKTGKIGRQEEEFVFAEAALTSAGGGTAEQKRLMKEAYAEMQAAGSDVTKITAAREKARSVSASVGISGEQLGGFDEAHASLSGEASERLSNMHTGALQSRMSSLLRRRFTEDRRFTSAMGLTADQSGAFGMGVANMNPMLRTELGRIMSMDPEQKALALADFRDANPELESQIGPDFKKFMDVAGSAKLSRDQIETFANAPTSYKDHKGFISAYAQQETAKTEFHNMLLAQSNSQLPNRDIMAKMMEGIVGKRTFSMSETMNYMLSKKDPALASLEMDGDYLKDSESNLAALKGVLGDDEFERLGLNQSGALSDKAKAQEVYMEIGKSGRGILLAEGKMHVAQKDAVLKANSSLTSEAIRGELKVLTGSASAQLPGESDADYSFRLTKEARMAMSDESKVDAAIKGAAGASTDYTGAHTNRRAMDSFKAMYGSDLLEEKGGKANIQTRTTALLEEAKIKEAQIKKEMEAATDPEAKGAKMTSYKEAFTYRKGLEELSKFYVTGGSLGQQAKDMVVTAANVVVNQLTKDGS